MKMKEAYFAGGLCSCFSALLLLQQDPLVMKYLTCCCCCCWHTGEVFCYCCCSATSCNCYCCCFWHAGEVFCYADADKPPVGQELNCDAEISLYGVYKKDKATGQVLLDGPKLAQWERKLRSMCAQLGAKFVSYKASAGVWKFEVRGWGGVGGEVSRGGVWVRGWVEWWGEGFKGGGRGLGGGSLETRKAGDSHGMCSHCCCWLLLQPHTAPSPAASATFHCC